MLVKNNSNFEVQVVVCEPMPADHLEALKELIKKAVNKPQKHIIHKAIEWKEMLVDGSARSYSEIAEKEGLTRARVTQIMNLLKLPPEWKAFLAGLDNPKDISENRR